MHNYVRISAGLATLLALAACGRGSTRTALGDDLKKDLQLASSSIDLASANSGKLVLSPVEELPPVSRPEHARTPKKAPGPKAVRSKTPTVKAAPTNEVAAAEPPAASQTTTPASPPPVAEPDLPPATRPSPTPGPQPGAGRVQDDGGSGGGVLGVLGTIVGAVIRGGAVDGDHCEPHGHGRRGGVWNQGPYGYPAPGGGRSPFPITP